MSKHRQTVSVIVPVYNEEEHLDTCIQSLLSQTISTEEMQIILINDGSSDNSPAMCDAYAEKHDFIKAIHKENSGPSATRNLGLQNATGKYIMFLDSDDRYEKDTVKEVTDFFDAHYDEVDLTTYNIVRIDSDGEEELEHFRFEILKESGVYDLTLGQNAYIMQTTMNVCVKNRFDDNILFHENLKQHEDQLFCITHMAEKMTLGYCNKGSYLYLRNPNSLVSTTFHAYYIFESTMKMWEGLFAHYDGTSVPAFIQSMYLNDICWKLKSNILLPFHYSEKDLQHARDRLRTLLLCVDDAVIANHPKMDMFNQQFFFFWKYGKENTKREFGPSFYGISHDDDLLFAQRNIEIVLTKTKTKNGMLKLVGFVKSAGLIYFEKPKLFWQRADRNETQFEVPLTSSSWSYYFSKDKTANFWSFAYDIPINEQSTGQFRVEIDNHVFSTLFLFHFTLQVSSKLNRPCMFANDHTITFNNESIDFTKGYAERAEQENALRKLYMAHGRKFLLIREIATRLKRRSKQKNRRIWLYSDAENVRKDNGYYQFIHDFEKKDGVERYYICHEHLNYTGLFEKKHKKSLIPFGSTKHKFLTLQAEKILAAFIEKVNFLPFFVDAEEHYADLLDYDLIYLQHGVLSATTPWKYALDRLPVDKFVISTTFEHKNMIQNYNYTDDYLLPSGMPRYDHIDRSKKPERTILFAPSWREYLIILTNQDTWLPDEKRFRNSDYFKTFQSFLSSQKLIDLLEKHDYYLDFKLHPIFVTYKKLFTLQNRRIRFASESVDESSYSIFMTDFSSFVFDFAYLKRPVLYFVPDYDQFRSGMNDYFRLDMPLEDGLGPFVRSCDDAVHELHTLLENECTMDDQYKERMDNLFYDVPNHSEALYNALMAD